MSKAFVEKFYRFLIGINRKSNDDLVIISIIEMPHSAISILILTLLVSLVHSETQTGYVDLNAQLGDLQIINEDANVICYEEVFLREFSRTPKITAALAEFKTESERDFQLFVKIRNIDVSKTNAKFSVLARKEVSLWSKIIFSFLATDHEDIIADIALLQTQNLSGCGKILSQTFKIELSQRVQSPQIAAYVSGFDVSLAHNENINLELSTQVVKKDETSFLLEVSRKTMIQIYHISIGYVVVSKDPDTKLQVTSIEQILDDIPSQSPYIYVKPHKFELKHANMYMGFQKFQFRYPKGESIVKSLALTINEQYMVIGCLDSSILQYLEVSYLIVKDVIDCKRNEILFYDPEKKSIQCQQCDKQENRMPNFDKDQCICQQGFYEINNKCYEKPDKGEFDLEEQAFVCDKDFSMVYNKLEDAFSCQKAPQHKLFDSDKGEWVCIDKYFEVDGQCLTIPQQGYFNIKTRKVECKNERVLVEGQCVESGENQEYSFAYGKFVCKQGFYKIDKACIKPMRNAYYDDEEGKFICHHNFYMSQSGKCQKVPPLMKFDEKLNKLTCQENFYYIKNIGCEQLPSRMKYNDYEEKFECVNDYYMINGKCKRPSTNQVWSEELNSFVCQEGTYRIDSTCLQPKQNSHFSQISLAFECNEGFYDINGACLELPANMEYSKILKQFFCLKGYYLNAEGNCEQIPQHMVWSIVKQKLVCMEEYHMMADKTCRKAGKHEIYLAEYLKFQCNSQEGFWRINKLCRKLPKFSTYQEKQQDFKCISKYYKHNDQCEPCPSKCLECEDSTTCTKCRSGFELDNGICEEKCGDGIRFQAQCDDSNKKSGDGCSADCQQEDGYICEGGSSTSADVCEQFLLQASESVKIPDEPIDLRMVGMSHLYGKIILNVKLSYVPITLLSNSKELTKIFRVLTNSKISLKVSSMYIDTSEYTFVVLYDFNKFEPIPEYLTRIQIAPEIKQKYYKSIKVNPLFIRVNPALMARRSSDNSDQII